MFNLLYPPFLCMAQRGFFGLLALLGAVQAIVLMGAFAGQAQANYGSLQATLSEIEKTGFERTQAEMLFDRSIGEALESAQFGKINAAQIKERADRAILDAAGALGIEIGLCWTGAFGNALPAAQGQGIGKVSKAIAIRAYGAAIVQYTITGGPLGSLSPCARLRNGAYAQTLMVPAGYSATRLVPMP